ncbi:hypothetical protein [Pleionea sp. CnH1-48]|uniref:hypothetical protein n=1 Tax=Pleionea sp. CnH1-48 TaxID=2954494 RepID=UPI002098316E|nr:hypothetical protein [Pleionea sp. CnH1-48]MCO7223651.1 hypothetical protein [Pleionea sp. CnH1-48]
MNKILSIIGLLSIATTVQASSLTTSATFQEGLPLHLETNIAHNATVDFGASFESIDRICFTAHFTGDLADPNEGFMMGPFGSASYGWTNINSTPIASRTTCITPAHTGASDFLDGAQTFGVKMYKGQATLSSLDVTITGTINQPDLLEVDIVKDDPNYSVPAEGGKLKYDALIRNLDYDLSYKNFNQWSSLTLPTGEAYPVHKSRQLELSSGEEKSYTRPYINIPTWFPAGEYTFTWYVADPLNDNKLITQDSFTFNKLPE